MLICGLKLTHDGSVALLDGNRLIFSVEMEKIANGRRYDPVSDLSIISRILVDFGYKVSDIDEWVIDGWDGDASGRVSLLHNGAPVDLVVGPYRESDLWPDLVRTGISGEFPLGSESHPYTSYSHAAGHLASAYCSSPFAARQEPSFVLVWDGGLFPRLYWVDPKSGVKNHGELFPLIGHAYAAAGHHFGPFRRKVQSPRVDDLAIAGKLMAYIALGEVRPSLLRVLSEEFHAAFESGSEQATEYRESVGGFGSLFEPSMPPVHAFFDAVRRRVGPAEPDENVLASMHHFFQGLLVERITSAVQRAGGAGPWNLCAAGGCALNIKWNSALRSLPLFREMWVPPFPNDSGSAIGAAVLGMIQHRGFAALDWHARLGPSLLPVGDVPDGWSASACGAEDLARLLHETGEPVVLLRGRAELGPRALGGRSILATATRAGMKNDLNRIKGREPYRPVAPICLVDEAPRIFDPGTPDPYMLFDHRVRDEWAGAIPAAVHLDGTARLQTVAPDDDPFLTDVLRAYHRLTGIPVLCNTSANLSGHGFFPDAASAMSWGRVNRVWSEGTLYQRVGG